MNTFTKAEVRGAILRTAETFERNPPLLSLNSDLVPQDGGRGCLLAYIGKYLGIKVGTSTVGVDWLRGAGYTQFRQDIYAAGHDFNTLDAYGFPAALRAYADMFYPAESRALVPMGTWSDVHALIGWRPREERV